MPELTQERLKELIHYDRKTGEFTWVKTKSSRAIAGSSAGSIDINGYRRIKIDGVKYRASRLAVLYVDGCFPSFFSDHINHIRCDDRFINLRKATVLDNNKNRSISKKNTSGFIGVSISRGMWRAQIGIDGKIKHLGRFLKKSDAIKARKAANIKYGFHANHGSVI